VIFKGRIKALLDGEDYAGLMELSDAHGGKVGNSLISLAADLDEDRRWRAIRALGLVTARIYDREPEQARRVVRQLIWNLNEESGGIGWGMPEAFGEILAVREELALEYGPLLASYLLEPERTLDHEELQRGVIWALGRLKVFPEDTREEVVPALIKVLRQDSPTLRATAAWALGEMGAREAFQPLKDLPKMEGMLSLWTDNKLIRISLNETVEEAKAKLSGEEVDGMNDWKCSKCGYALKADAPPEKCPSCNETCEFVNVTCYIPECGFTGSDDRLKGES
jgi:rubredoxin